MPQGIRSANIRQYKSYNGTSKLSGVQKAWHDVDPPPRFIDRALGVMLLKQNGHTLRLT